MCAVREEPLGALVNDSAEALRVALADRYLLGEELGHGGMAVVYRAHDLRHGRDVAVKVMRPEVAVVLGADRFLQEIQIAARLTHPHIMALHDSGTAAGRLYYVMPLAEGETLAQRLAREGPLPLEDALSIAADVAEALAYAHAHGVVHRDIKPGNVLLSAGHAQVADFGLARAVHQAQGDGISQAGIAVGTPEYMSPEQSAGGSVDGRSDVYALGCVVYEMLAGEPPFRGRTAQAILARHIADPVPSIRTVRAGVPVSMAKVIERALAKVPADRYATATAFMEALAASAPSRPLSRFWVGALAAVALLAVLGVGIWRLVEGRAVGIDPNAVVGFPLVEVDSAATGRLDGERVAIMIGSALEHAEPLRWVDGWTWLGPRDREDPRRLTDVEARRITRKAGARYFIDGRIVRNGDSATVMLLLHDARRDVIVSRASASGTGDGASLLALGYAVVNELLPAILGGRTIDRAALDALAQRRPAAVANWIQGELAYRHARFDSALVFLQRAVEADSSLAFAALRGAQAADWQEEHATAAALVQVTLRRDGLLPPKYVHFAHGLGAYLKGDADSAVAQFRQALALDSSWAQAWTMLGESYFHLLPDVARPDSLATVAFETSRRRDPDFAPPLYHLTQLAFARGDRASGDRLYREYASLHPVDARRFELELIQDCVRDGGATPRWVEAVGRSATSVMLAGQALALGGKELLCAETAFRTCLDAADASGGVKWAAFLGLHALLIESGRVPAARALIDSVRVTLPPAMFLYFLDTAAGVDLGPGVDDIAGSLGTDFGPMPPEGPWVVGLWAFGRGDSALVRKAAVALGEKAGASGSPMDSSLAVGMAARSRVMAGDTTAAIALLSTIRSVAPEVQIAWGLWEPLAPERLLLARLLAAKGQGREVARVQDAFSGTRPMVFRLFLPAITVLGRGHPSLTS